MTHPEQPADPTRPYPAPYQPQPYSTQPYPTQSYPAQSYPPPQPYPAPSHPGHHPPHAYPHGGYAAAPGRRPVSATGPAALAFGLLALLIGWVPLFGVVGIAFGVAGALFALKALSLAERGVVSDRGLAIAGMVLSCAAIAIGVVVNVVVVVAVAGR